MKRFEFDHKDRKHLIGESLRCPVCDGTIYPRGTIEHGMVQYLRFECPSLGHHAVLRVDTIDGNIKMHFYALPDDVTFGWFHDPIDEPTSQPIASMPESAISAPESIASKMTKAQEQERQMRIERIANALEAHRLIAELVLSRRRKEFSFVDRSTVLARLDTLRGRKVWAVDANHPTVTKIIDDHGGKIVLARTWEEQKLIVVSQQKRGRSRVCVVRTHDVRLGSGTEVYCYLFLEKQFEAARRSQLQIGSLF